MVYEEFAGLAPNRKVATEVSDPAPPTMMSIITSFRALEFAQVAVLIIRSHVTSKGVEATNCTGVAVNVPAEALATIVVFE
jgi:hypothetical protein